MDLWFYIRNYSICRTSSWLALAEGQLAIQHDDTNSEATNSERNTEDEELSPGGQETLLESNQTHNEGILRITMAPGEGQKPLDADSE